MDQTTLKNDELIANARRRLAEGGDAALLAEIETAVVARRGESGGHRQ